MTVENKLCPNGHDTRNEIGNCYTCGEPFDAPELKIESKGEDPEKAHRDSGRRYHKKEG